MVVNAENPLPWAKSAVFERSVVESPAGRALGEGPARYRSTSQAQQQSSSKPHQAPEVGPTPPGVVAVRVTICDQRHLHIGRAVESKGRRCLARGYLLQDRRGHGGVEGGRLAEGSPDQAELTHRFSVGDVRSVA